MSKRRKILLTLLVALFAADLTYFYVKTRPIEPIAVFDFVGNYTTASWEDPSSVKNAIYLQSDGKWTLKDGQKVNPMDMADLTIPNTDSPDYWVWINSRRPITFGYALSATQSLAKLGICNFVFLEAEHALSDEWFESPVLTLDLYSMGAKIPLQKCQTSSALNKRYKLAAAEYRRTRIRRPVIE